MGGLVKAKHEHYRKPVQLKLPLWKYEKRKRR